MELVGLCWWWGRGLVGGWWMGEAAACVRVGEEEKGTKLWWRGSLVWSRHGVR